MDKFHCFRRHKNVNKNECLIYEWELVNVLFFIFVAHRFKFECIKSKQWLLETMHFLELSDLTVISNLNSFFGVYKK
jgi:hypothetical protein